MTFIADENVFKAVNFASSMIKKGTPIGLAIYKAASYYKVATKKVAHYLGKRGASKSQMNKLNK